MKFNYYFLRKGWYLYSAILLSGLMTPKGVNGQATCSTPTNISNFGVDGDVKANTPPAIMGDSWFFSNVYPGTGIGVIGTNAATAQPPISSAAFNTILQNASNPSARNRMYVQRMSVPPLSLVNGMILIDAFAVRDFISPDSTAFLGSNKNGDNPSVWSIGSSSVPTKNDIIDAGGHLRRQPSASSVANDLWMFAYISRLGTSGDAYSDIEIFRTVPVLNVSTGQLSNTGPAATGGHTAFNFSSTAQIANPGDIIIGMNYNSSGGTASIRIWCNINNLNGAGNGYAWFNSQPNRPFNFTGSTITGTGSNGYGYAEITALSGASCLRYSVLNSANTPAGDWGNLTGSGAAYDTNIQPGQLVNIAFNFTDMGLDFSSVNGPCFNIFGALWFKTRTSSSYSSELKDAAGPYALGNFSEIQANAGPDQVLNCTTTQVTLSGSSATSGATLSWITPNGNIVSGGNTATPVVNATGMYILTAANPTLSSCVAYDTVFVTGNTTIPVANAGADKQINCFSNTALLSGSSTAVGAVYSWIAINSGNIVSGANAATPLVNAAGCYVVTVTNPANGCSQTDTACVALNLGVPVISGVTQVNVGCFGTCTGAVSFTTSGGQAPYTYNWSSGANTASLTNLCAGNYTVTVTGSNGCTASANYPINQPAAFLTSTVTVAQNVNCAGGSNGAATASVNGGIAPYSYLWSNGATSAAINGLTAGTYTVTITDQNGCTSSKSTTISQPLAGLSGSLVMSQAVSCRNGANGALNLSVNGGTVPYTYLWSNSAVTQNISGVTAGSYSVTVTDANGCTINYNAAISQPAASLNATATVAANVSCFSGNNGAVSLIVSGGTAAYTYNWSNGATTQNLSGVASGVYGVTVTDANGCIKIASATVTQPVAALSSSVVINSNVSCFGGNNGSLNLSTFGGTAPYNYNWSNGQTTEDLSGTTAGVYTVTITDQNGCTTTKNATISQPSAGLSGSLVMSQAVSCRSGANGALNLTVNGGTVPYTYLWSNGALTQDISGAPAGSYTVTVTDANGCTINYNAAISQPAASLNATAAVTANVSCFSGNNGVVSLSVSGGTAAYSYNWSNGTTTQNLSGVASGVYSVTVTDANGCTKATSATVTQPAAALSSSAVISPNVSCFGGNNGGVNLSIFGGTAPYNYNWSNGQTTEDLNGLTAGNYTVTVTDLRGCITIRTVTITQPSAALSATASQSQAVSCNAGNNGQISVAVIGGTIPYSYQWSNGSATQAINNLSAGTYTVTVTDVNGCTQISSASITQPSTALSGTTTNLSNISCFAGNNGSVSLTVVGGTAPYSFMWSTGALSQNLSGVPAGTYNVTITDANGCIALSSSTITQPPGELGANLVASQNVICFGGGNGSFDLTVNGGTAPYSYNWNTGATTEDISGLATGVYTVNITDGNGCISAATGTITQPAGSLAASISSSQPVSCFGYSNGSLDLTVTGGTAPYFYNWSDGATSQDINNLASGTYTVTITDINGCTTQQSSFVTQPTPALSSSAGIASNVSCYSGTNGSIDLTVLGGVAPYSYSWSNGMTTEDMSGLTADIYTVNVTDANGCNTTTSVTVTEPLEAVSLAANVNQTVSCFGGNNGEAIAVVSGGTAPYAYLWDNGATIATAIGLTSGSYSVTVTDNNGCTENVSVAISQPVAPLDALVSASPNVSCFGGVDGSADLIVSGGTSPYTFLWNTGEITEDVSGLSNGTYTVTVTDANNCISTQNLTISQPAAALTSATTVTQNVLCNGGNIGAANVTVNGGTAPYGYSWSNGEITSAISNLIGGWYYVNIIDVNGCIAEDSLEITQPASALVISLNSGQNLNCFGDSLGSIDINVVGGTAPYTYLWNTSEITEDISNLSTGTYIATVTDANLCEETIQVFISQPTAPLLGSITVTLNVFCNGGSNGALDLNLNGGTFPYTYLWSTGAINEDINNIPAGSYTVTATDANGCSMIVSESIGQPSQQLSIAATLQDVLCFNGNSGNVDITPSGGTAPYTYAWNTGAITEDIAGLAAGTYVVTVSDTLGCIALDSIVITQPAMAIVLSLNAIQNVNCFGDANGSIDINVNGGTGPYTYLWDNGETTEDISNLTTGTYIVTITDANLCEETIQVYINQPLAPLIGFINVVSNVFCNGGSTGALDLNLNGGTFPYTYLWSNGEITEDISGLSVDIYTVTVTDANGCSAVATAGIGQPNQQLNATATLQNVLCFNGNNGNVDITPSGGTVPYTYVWNTGAITEDIGGLVAGTYVVTVSDANGCDTSITVAITQPAAPLIPILQINQNVSCFGGNNGTIELTIMGGTAPFTYLWNNGATTSTINGLASGAYTVTVTDANGCNAIISDFVTQPAAPLDAPVSVSQNVSCLAGSDGSLITNATGGTAPYAYLWNTGATTSGLTGLSAGTYTVTVTDSLGCIFTATAQVNQPAASVAVTGSTVAANCLDGVGGAITTQVTGGTPVYAFLWSNGAITQDITNASPGSYTVTVTDANGCIASDNFVVDNNSSFALNSGPAIICLGETAALIADSVPNGNYQWYFEGSPLSGATGLQFITPTAGYYYVTVTVPCGTFMSDSVEVVVKTIENASITNNQIICPPEAVQLQATGGVTYQWSPASFMTFSNIPDPIVNPPVSMTYSVLITNEWGCKTTLQVDIAADCDTLFIPNGFSPNDDGTNDGFVIDGIENYPGNILWVFNRWGNLVFKTKNYDNKWNGVSNVSGIYMGKKVPTGTYYYVIDLNDNSKPRAGFLIIRR